MGAEVKIYLFEPDDFSTTSELAQDLRSERGIDVVEIGAGVRTIPIFLLYFEKLVNLVAEQGSRTRLCFNKDPSDTITAVQRWL